MSELKNCKFCAFHYWDRRFQCGYCKVKGFTLIGDRDWSAKHCPMYKIDEAFNPAKMTALIKCINCEYFSKGKEELINVHCNKRHVHIAQPRLSRTCQQYKQRKTGEYVRINWNTHGNLHGIDEPVIGYANSTTLHQDRAIKQINKHTKKNKFHALHDVPFGVASVGDSSWRIDEGPPSPTFHFQGNTHIQGDLTVKGEIKMNENIEKRVKDKQEKINKIIETRKEYIKSWLNRFTDLDSDIRYKYILKYSWLRSDFRKYILNNIGRKTKGLNTSLKRIGIDLNSNSIKYGKAGKKIRGHLLSGEKWNFVKKILAIINKYAIMYANERLKAKYSELTSKYDALLYDDETIICEACGTENQIIALFCNSCGKKF